jgi:hypothetical protein
MLMQETLQEFFDSRGLPLRVDRESGILRGVKILGLASRNGRTYLPQALSGAIHLYEGAKVNVNHPKGSPVAPRDYQDRIGILRGITLRENEGLFGDFHYNPKHALAGQLIWDAEHSPENVGFSHNVQARTSRSGDQVLVEAITKVTSVDLVADPATTHGLFEARSVLAADAPSPATGQLLPASELTLPALRTLRPDLVEELLAAQAGELGRLQSEVDRLQLQESLREKRQLARRLLAEFKLPDPDAPDPWSRAISSERFLETLWSAGDEAAMRRLVEERAELVRSVRSSPAPATTFAGKPTSRDQHLVEGSSAVELDTKAFVRAIT